MYAIIFVVVVIYSEHISKNVKSLTIFATTIFAILVLVPTQVYAYTVIEFAIADKPLQYQNVTYTIEDRRLFEEYEWLHSLLNTAVMLLNILNYLTA